MVTIRVNKNETVDYKTVYLGYFTHVTTLAEVKEQVLKYIPVMARPLVLMRETHPVRWTGVYADIEVRWKLHVFHNWKFRKEG